MSNSGWMPAKTFKVLNFRFVRKYVGETWKIFIWGFLHFDEWFNVCPSFFQLLSPLTWKQGTFLCKNFVLSTYVQQCKL